MKLIAEQLQDVEFIKEEKDNGKKDYKNKRYLYAGRHKEQKWSCVSIWMFLTKKSKDTMRNIFKKNRAFGELGHPEGPTVNLDRASHMITKLEPDGKNMIGEAKIMDTPMGKIVKTLMDEGAKLGVSSRGMGSLEPKNGANYVKKDFYLATAADIVADPSAPNAFVEGIYEGKEWVWDNGSLIESELQRMKRRIDERVRKRQANENALEFAKYLKML